MIGLGNIQGILSLNAQGYMTTLKTAKKETENFKNQMGGIGDKMTTVGKGMTAGLTVPILGIGATALKGSMDFEAGMSNVQALSGATGDDLQALENIAREMGSKTKYSAKEASEGLEYMALAGWDTEQMIAGLEPSLKLAGAANMDLGQSTDIVTDTMSMFGMEAQEATKMTDMLAYAQANSNTDVAMLGEALKYAGASANAMGYDMADTTAILGLFADQGLKGSAAGTTLNAMFRDMKDKSEDGAIAIGENNVAIVDAEGNYRDFADIMEDTIGATEGMTVAERDRALGAIFGTQAIKGVNMVMEAGSDTLKEFEEDIRNSDGAASDMYDTMQDNLKGAFDTLKSAVSEAGLSIGDTLIPIIQSAAEWINKWVDRFNSLDDSTKETIVKIGLLVAAIGPVLMIVGKVISIGGALMGGIGALSGVLGVLAGPVGAVMAVVGVGILLYKNWDTIKEKAGELKDNISKRWDDIKTATSEKWENVKETVSDKWENIKTSATEGAKTVYENTLGRWIDTVKESKEKWGEVAKAVKDKYTDIKKEVIESGTKIFRDVKSAWEDTEGTTIEKWGAVLKSVTTNLGEIKDNIISSMEESNIEWVSNLGSMLSAANEKWGEIKSKASETFGEVKSAIGSAIDRIRDWNSQRVENKTATFTTINTTINETIERGRVSHSKYAQGTNYHTGGMALVGELGPEIVELPKGSKVRTHAQSKELMGGGEMKHSGTIRIEGINNHNELEAVTEIVMDQLRREVRL